MIRITDFDNVTSLFHQTTEVEWAWDAVSGTAVVTTNEVEDGQYVTTVTGDLPDGGKGLPYMWRTQTQREAIQHHDSCVHVLRTKPRNFSSLAGPYGSLGVS